MSAARLNPEARLRLEKLAKVGPRAKSVTHSLKQQEAGSEKDSTGTPLRATVYPTALEEGRLLLAFPLRAFGTPISALPYDSANLNTCFGS